MTDVHNLYPVAIVQDRYSGTYSKGGWLAVANHDEAVSHEQTRWQAVEDGANGDDGSALCFWIDPPPWIAVGDTPDAAFHVLLSRDQGA